VGRVLDLGRGDYLFFVYLSYHTTHTTTAERRAENQCQRRGASSGQKTKRGIEGEDPAAAGIERFFLLPERSSRRFGFFFFHYYHYYYDYYYYYYYYYYY